MSFGFLANVKYGWWVRWHSIIHCMWLITLYLFILLLFKGIESLVYLFMAVLGQITFG